MPENTTHESPAYEKRGYLNHEFRLFHLRRADGYTGCLTTIMISTKS